MINSNKPNASNEKSNKDITSSSVDKLNDESPLKYNQNLVRKNSIKSNKANANAESYSIEGNIAAQNKLLQNKMTPTMTATTDITTTNNINSDIKNNQRSKTQKYFHKQTPHSINKPFPKAMTRTKEIQIQNKLLVKKKNNKTVYSKLYQSSLKNRTSRMQTEPNVTKHRNYFYRPLYSSSSTNNKKQFYSTTATSFYKRIPIDFPSNPYSNPNLISFYCQQKNGEKYFSDLNRDYYQTQSPLGKQYNPTTDFKHAKFQNKFLSLTQRKKSSATSTMNIQRNNEWSMSKGKGSENANNSDHYTHLFSMTMPNKMYQPDDSSYNKFIFLTANNSSKEKQKLIYKFIRQREKREKRLHSNNK